MENNSNESVSVVKICTPLSNNPFFIRVPSGKDLSIDAIVKEAIAQLSNTGKPLESQQLDQLYKSHQIFSSGRVVEKGALFSELEKKQQMVSGKEISVAELDLVSSHSGGDGSTDGSIGNFFKLMGERFEEGRIARQNLGILETEPPNFQTFVDSCFTCQVRYIDDSDRCMTQVFCTKHHKWVCNCGKCDDFGRITPEYSASEGTPEAHAVVRELINKHAW